MSSHERCIKKTQGPHGDQDRAIPPSPKSYDRASTVCVPFRLRERPSKGAERKPDLRRGGMAVGIEGRGAQNGVKERVRVGQLVDDGGGRVLDDARDSQASKLSCSAAQRCLQFPAGKPSHTQQLGRCQFSNDYGLGNGATRPKADCGWVHDSLLDGTSCLRGLLEYDWMLQVAWGLPEQELRTLWKANQNS